MENVMKDCGFPKDVGKYPIHFENPIFGSFEDQWQRYLAPGVIMTMVYFLAALLTASIFIHDRSDGVWDRTLVSGISTTEMLLAHLICQSVILVLQTFEVIIYVKVVFAMENRGEHYLIILLLIMTGFSGMLFGLILSIYCESQTMANFVATGVFYPMIMLCGLFWPLEAMPYILQKIALFLPFTIPSVSYRNITEKGWTFTNFQVMDGFLVTIFWIIFMLVICIIGLRIRK